MKIRSAQSFCKIPTTRLKINMNRKNYSYCEDSYCENYSSTVNSTVRNKISHIKQKKEN